MQVKLTMKEVALAVVLAIMGFAFSLRQFILVLSMLNPLVGLLLYYAIFFISLVLLSKFELVIFGFKIKNLSQTLGVLLITFAFFTCINWESAYVQYVATGSLQSVSTVFLQSEDGAVFWVWQQLLPFADIETWRILTYVVTPFFLALIGGVLASDKVKLK